MSTVPNQCKNLRCEIRRKQRRFLLHLSGALPNMVRTINVIITDYCLPSRAILDAIETTAHRRTNIIVETTDALGERECVIQYQPCRYQGYGLFESRCVIWFASTLANQKQIREAATMALSRMLESVLTRCECGSTRSLRKKQKNELCE